MLARTPRLALVSLLALAVLVLTGSAGAVGGYVDPTGDANGAPDITHVSIAADDAGGQIVFTISVDSLPQPANVLAFLFLDTDMNQATGAPDTLGADYLFGLDQSDNTYGFARWDGSAWDWDTPYSTVSVRTNSNAVLISVNRSELGNTDEFNFWTRMRAGDAVDDAPDDGTWNFSLKAGGPEIRSIQVKTTPLGGPRAGTEFTVTPFGLQVPTNGLPGVAPAPDRYTCTATVTGKPIAGHGVGRCSWKLPKKARGKTLTVAVTATYQGASLTSTFRYRVSK